MKTLLIALVISFVSLSAHAEEGMSCVADDGSAFIADMFGIASNGSFEDPGYQFMIIGLKVFRPNVGVNTYGLTDLIKPIETMMQEESEGWSAKDAYTRFDLKTISNNYGQVEITRPNGKLNAPWKGIWSLNASQSLSVTCYYARSN